MESKNGLERRGGHPSERPVVIDASASGAWERVGGRLLLERISIECRRLGFKKIVILIPVNRSYAKSHIIDTLPCESIIRFRGDAIRALLRCRIVKNVFLYINAGYLIDPRLVAYLTSTSLPCYVPDEGEGTKDKEVRCRRPEIRDRKSEKAYLPLSYFRLLGSVFRNRLLPSTLHLVPCFSKGDDSNQPVLGLFTKSDLIDWAIGDLEGVLKRSKKVSPDMVEKYNPEIRGEQEPYIFKVNSMLDAARATWLLITRNQKKVMDLPSMYIDPPFENGLTFLLCYTPVTPNQVTIFNLIVAFIVGCLFLNGHFVCGALLTYAAEILDGVDGKLARAKIIFSKLGEYECYVDFFYEHWWYVAIALGLRHLGYGPNVWWAWAVLAICDIWDNILYTMSEHWYGKSLDLLSPFDASFRKIAGRRNIYALIFLVGFLLGYPFSTFSMAAAWAFITASIHTYRLAKSKIEGTRYKGE